MQLYLSSVTRLRVVHRRNLTVYSVHIFAAKTEKITSVHFKTCDVLQTYQVP